MPLVINSNIQSLNSQRQLVKSGNELSQAMERLSSGKRINTAGDDAAGLAISNRMTSQVKGLDRAVANANDGVSLIQTAEGALDETTNILQRMRELSIQSANGIYSDDDRKTIDAEVQQLKAEINRISETTSFNGQKVLDGSLGEVKLQVGAESNQTIDFKIGATNINSLGTGSGGDVVGSNMQENNLKVIDGSTNSVMINGQNIGNLTASNSLSDSLNTINNNVSDVKAAAFVEVNAGAQGTGVLQGTAQLDLTVVNQDGTTSTYQVNDTSSMEELAKKISDTTGGALQASVNEQGRLAIKSDSAASIQIGGTGQAAATGVADGTTNAQLTLTSTDGGEVKISANNLVAQDAIGLNSRSDGGDVEGISSKFSQLNEGDVKINGVSIGASASDSATDVASAINAKSEETGVVAEVIKGGARVLEHDTVTFTGGDYSQDYSASADSLTLTFDGNSITVNDSGTLAEDDVAAAVKTALESSDGFTGEANVTYTDAGGLSVQFTDRGNASKLTALTATHGGSTETATRGASGGDTVQKTTVSFTGDLSQDYSAASDSLKITYDSNDIVINNSSTLAEGDVAAAIKAALESSSGFTGEANVTYSDADGLSVQFTDRDNVAKLTAVAATHSSGTTETTTRTDSVDLNASVGDTIKLNSVDGKEIALDLENGVDLGGLKEANVSDAAKKSVANIDISTQAGAQKAIEVIDGALEQINSTRADMGAVTNRLEHTMSNLMNISENTSSARSRIQDADFASETANLSRAQVLQQASSAMLAQANSAPQQVLSLLR